MEFTVQMLFRVPTQPGAQAKYGVKLEFNKRVYDDDNDGTAFHDRTRSAMNPNLGTTVLGDYVDRGMYCILQPTIVKLVNPVVP